MGDCGETLTGPMEVVSSSMTSGGWRVTSNIGLRSQVKYRINKTLQDAENHHPCEASEKAYTLVHSRGGRLYNGVLAVGGAKTRADPDFGTGHTELWRHLLGLGEGREGGRRHAEELGARAFMEGVGREGQCLSLGTPGSIRERSSVRGNFNWHEAQVWELVDGRCKDARYRDGVGSNISNRLGQQGGTRGTRRWALPGDWRELDGWRGRPTRPFRHQLWGVRHGGCCKRPELSKCIIPWRMWIIFEDCW